MSVFAAAALVVLKLGTGLVAGSLGLVSAGIESSGDVVAAVLTLFAIRLGGRPADANHPYGHRRAENLAALGEAAILTAGGIVVVVEAFGRLAGRGRPLEAHWYVFAVIVVALALDLSRVLVSLGGAARYKSAALRSNAFHFAGDMAGSLAVLAGLAVVSAGFHQGDALAALLVAAIIFSAAARLIVENARVLMDTMPAETIESLPAPSLGSCPQPQSSRRAAAVEATQRQARGRAGLSMSGPAAPFQTSVLDESLTLDDRQRDHRWTPAATATLASQAEPAELQIHDDARARSRPGDTRGACRSPSARTSDGPF